MWHTDFQAKARQHFANSGAALNDSAARYGVRVDTADAAATAAARAVFRCVGIHHLTNQENDMKHNIYVDILGISGARLMNYPIAIRDEKKNRKPLILDKPDTEPAGNYPLFWSDTLAVKVLSEFPSDEVVNLHSRHGDEGDGNRQGHHSFYLEFQLIEVEAEEEEEAPKDCSFEQIVACLKKLLSK